ncbi:MAG: MMPL family transporter [Pseudomonas sp.]|jgi:hypothetical protein|uniref:SSD domain-containing protein n=1 Tax=Pseudomonas psychrophila TaxID=122355 RepID=A0ABY0VPY1_9PSED|nr:MULTISPECIES: MMPL family transporter [Pseudomonas]KAB0493523.1 MMPL family transporter [Pseudomonas psychrophila]MBL1307481.1 MMPL family transporter [Pseudomonas sp.]QIE32416.1 MMPL family transporter [Pseudomonas psychrophila]WVI98960.1 MMPL family transporter [Pseudomonas psychrophila]SDU47994.1 hypothetical protein SAMN04490201_1918 [Pseudomonas psychrophila]
MNINVQCSTTASTFRAQDGSFLERLLFENRVWIVFCCLALTAFFSYQVRHLELNASYKAVIPNDHAYVQNYLSHERDLKGLGNTLRIIVANPHGDIFDPDYLKTLREINDAVFAIPGVERPYMQSLWTRSTRWLAVTEEGIDGGPVMPDAYDGTPKYLEALRLNILRSGEVGRLVAADMHSSAIVVPLLDYDAQAGQALDYGKLSQQLEAIRAKYQNDKVSIHIVGFAKVMGDLIDGLWQILIFFAIAVAIATAMVYWFTRCLRSTVLVVLCSLVAVLWLLGLLPMLGLRLDPYSILVPFLIFAIGMSHGAQKMNGVMQDVGRGLSRIDAARNTFRRLFLAGFTALVCDAVGFAVLFMVNIQAIRELALTASLGVAILIFTNLILLPILLTYTGVSHDAARRALASENKALAGGTGGWNILVLFTRRPYALAAICTALLLTIGGAALATRLQVGDLDAGAPELRADSQYNIDNAFVNGHYATSSDVLAIMVTTSAEQCADYATLVKVRELQSILQRLPGTDATVSFTDLAKQMGTAFNEGSLKWAELVPNQTVLNTIMTQASRGLFNGDCNMLTLYVYLRDHKASTLEQTVQTVETFAAGANTDDVKFLLAAGNAGIEAATNQVVKHNNYLMLLGVYLAVIILSLITFRSWRAVLVAILPLALTSLLAEALMVLVGVGLKVATLPVTALGVGIGIDYALYILSIMLVWLRAGASLEQAYSRALMFVGRVVLLTGMTLAAGVATWMFSPIKFQADMGLLLAFMFLVNMFGALVLLPSIACFMLKPTTQRPVTAPTKVIENA